MSVNDIVAYKRAVKEEKELLKLLDELDKVVDILYNNLGYSGMWSILNVAEDVRLQYYMKHHECELTIKNKGLTSYE